MAVDGLAAGEIIVKCSQLPQKITAGLTFDVRLRAPGYPAALWAAELLLRGPQSITLPASFDGDNVVIRANAGVTATWPAGDYWYSLRATSGDDVREIGTGQITILPDLAAVTDPYDGKTHAQRTLEAIEAVIEKRASMDQERYRINNRELYRTPITDLLKLRDLYRMEVAREQQQERGQNPFGRKVRVSLR